MKITSELNFPYMIYFQIDPLHTSMFSSSQADNGIASNMASGGHIGFEKCKNNPKNEFPTSINAK